jgi:hypothetical protein
VLFLEDLQVALATTAALLALSALSLGNREQLKNELNTVIQLL